MKIELRGTPNPDFIKKEKKRACGAPQARRRRNKKKRRPKINKKLTKTNAFKAQAKENDTQALAGKLAGHQLP